MIAKLKGIVDTIGSDWLIVDVNGVGYQVHASMKALSALPAEGEPVELLIETHVREDHIHLYGFLAGAELDMFRLLVSVQGVGTRVALAILSVMDPMTLKTALAAGDQAAVAEAQGVGPKLAARIVNELKDKVGGLPGSEIPAHLVKRGAGENDDFRDAISALVQLGYKPSQAHTALMTVSRKMGEGGDVSTLIKEGLKELSR